MGEPTWHQIPVAAGYLCECDHDEEEVPAVWQHGNGHFDHVPPDGVAYRCASHPPEPDPLAALRAQLAKVTAERDAAVRMHRMEHDSAKAIAGARDAALDLLEAAERYLTRAVAVEEAVQEMVALAREAVPSDVDAWRAGWAALKESAADLPPNPLEKVRAGLHDAGRTLTWPK